MQWDTVSSRENRPLDNYASGGQRQWGSQISVKRDRASIQQRLSANARVSVVKGCGLDVCVCYQVMALIQLHFHLYCITLTDVIYLLWVAICLLQFGSCHRYDWKNLLGLTGRLTQLHACAQWQERVWA